MTVGWYLPITPEAFRALSRRERGHLREAMNEWIEALNEQAAAIGKGGKGG